MATSVFNDWIHQIPWDDRVTPHLKPGPKYKVTSFIDSKGASNMKVELWPTCKFYLTHDLVKGDGVPNFCGYILVPKGLKDKIATEDGDVSPVGGSSGLKRKVDSQKGDGPMKKAKLKKKQVTSTTDTTSSRYISFPVSGTWKISSM